MKTLFLLASLALVSNAEARPYAPSLTCAQVKGLVDTQGEVVISTGTHTYERFVAHGGYCAASETNIAAWIVTRDQAQCFVGFYCGQSSD